MTIWRRSSDRGEGLWILEKRPGLRRRSLTWRGCFDRCGRVFCPDGGRALTLVVATGVFDILHPGHVFYLERSRALGDELAVVVARDVNVRNKPGPIVPEAQRLRMVSALRVVDRAMLGSKTDIFESIQKLKPDIITLGYDQRFDPAALESELSRRGLYPRIVRIEADLEFELQSSHQIVKKILERFAGRQV
jgi:FAD synthetase